jgi:hypothetical protein
MNKSPKADTWGIVATIKAPAEDLLAWAAYHLDAGAQRIFNYLDAPCPDAHDVLVRHPKIRVIDCDEGHWRKRRKAGKPQKHQVRQTLNATRAYRRQCKGLDWLIHIDVDEFLWSETPLSRILGDLPQTTKCARVFPIEVLAGGDSTAFKGHIESGPERRRISEALYPTYGTHLLGGFLSHVQGKLFVRPGLEEAQLRIHNLILPDGENPAQAILPGVDLCHLHARDWDSWITHYRYRLEKGSYRPELKPALPRTKGGLSVHELLSAIEAEDGEQGLRAFFEEVCADRPALRTRLKQRNLLRLRDLRLGEKRSAHFPDEA